MARPPGRHPRAGRMDPATTQALEVVLAKSLAAIDLLSGCSRASSEITAASARRSPDSKVPVNGRNLSKVNNTDGGYGFALAAKEYPSCGHPPRLSGRLLRV